MLQCTVNPKSKKQSLTITKNLKTIEGQLKFATNTKETLSFPPSHKQILVFSIGRIKKLQILTKHNNYNYFSSILIYKYKLINRR